MTIDDIEETRRILGRENVYHPLWNKAFRERTRALVALQAITECDDLGKCREVATVTVGEMCAHGHRENPQETLLSEQEVTSLLLLKRALEQCSDTTLCHVNAKVLKRLLGDWVFAASIRQRPLPEVQVIFKEGEPV